MKRFRVTLIAICLILGWLGSSDLGLYLRNTEPQTISIQELEASGAPREWLTITGGYQNLMEAINMSGTTEIDAFLVPLKIDADSPFAKVWFETRDPEIVAALKTYYFELESDSARQQFVDENQRLFYGQRNVTGMTPDNLVAESNRSKLIELLQEMNIQTSEDVLFISEGKEPKKWRGIFFTAVAFLGLLKVILSFKTAPQTTPETTDNSEA